VYHINEKHQSLRSPRINHYIRQITIHPKCFEATHICNFIHEKTLKT